LTHSPTNTLNELDSKEWVKSTKSWFVVNPRSRTKEELDHPAKFPEEVVKHFISFFTKENGWVIDPFAGVGSALIACRESSRNCIGIELHREFVKAGNRHLKSTEGAGNQFLIQGDARDAQTLISRFVAASEISFDFLITSPPYWDMLRKSRGGNESVHKERHKRGLKQYYSDSEMDLGNITDYNEYIDTLGLVFGKLKPLMKDQAYLTIIVQNMRDTDGSLKPIAWDLAKRMSSDYMLCQEMIWCQDNKKLGCWGYPTTYVSNVHHHYCLIFRNVASRRQD
jgi:DNA modification methylase